jgi:hypothetical protein
MVMTGMTKDVAEKILIENKGFVRKCVANIE